MNNENENRISGNTINWYPGHMAKAKREIAAALPLVDIVLELIDSRLPSSSQNPDFLTLFANKPTLTLLTKTSLCDRTKLPEWKRRLEESGRRVIAIDCRQNRDLSPVTAEIREILHEKLERAAAKGIKNQAIRCLVVGITNVGKSTFINTYTNSKKAKVEDRPGVTRQNQWVTAPGGIELLDTPGLLWHKFDDQLVGVLEQRVDVVHVVADGASTRRLVLGALLLEGLVIGGLLLGHRALRLALAEIAGVAAGHVERGHGRQVHLVFRALLDAAFEQKVRKRAASPLNARRADDDQAFHSQFLSVAAVCACSICQAVGGRSNNARAFCAI